MSQPAPAVSGGADRSRRGDRRWTVPNVLSAYRLLAVPAILWTIAAGHRDAFFVLVCVSLVSDILDGWIARRFHLETEFGARLDTVADLATAFVTFVGFIVLEASFVRAHGVAFASLLVMNLTPQLVCLARFRRPTSLHLYSSKITGYLQGFFILGYFLLGYLPWYFYAMVTFSLLAYTEALVILLVIPRLRSNVRGLYWVLSEMRRGT
jgi:cardiolipin synthase (CMP-forming)